MKERLVSFSVITLLFHVAVIFPFFGALVNFILAKYFDNAVVYAAVDLLFLYFGIAYVLHYFEKKVIVQDPIKVFKVSFALFALITLGIYIIHIKSSMSALELIGWFFFYWLKVVMFHELTKKYFYPLAPQYEAQQELQVQQEEAMVYCRQCGAHIRQSALVCPQCGAQQFTQSNDTSTVVKFFAGLGWSVALWFGSLFVTGFVIGVMHPKNAESLAQNFGEQYGLILLLASFVVTFILMKLHVLPGSGKKNS